MHTQRAQKQYFTRQLMNWHETVNTRSLPWKAEKDPYKIWLSEIILQQTRALQGLPYYLRFTEAYPTIHDLANAPDEEIFRIWQGLGYYNRCKNMLATARYIAAELGGTFPSIYEDILALKGIGPYTAAAIVSFAYGLPHAVVDGNVYRVLARYFGIDIPSDSTEGKKLFTALANELLYEKDSAGYNQAIMDLGATVCTPKNPDCPNCPLQKNCIAFKQDLIDALPVKTKKLVIKNRYFSYILFTYNKKLWIHKRDGRDIWENLYQPYLIEHTNATAAETLVLDASLQLSNIVFQPQYIDTATQRLTHQLIQFRFYTMHVNRREINLPPDGKWVPFHDLNNYAFPKTVVSFLEKIFYF